MPGFNSVQGDEAIMFADNASFDGTQRGGKMTTNAQLWIGSTASPHVKLGNITSPSGTITVGYSSPNITLDLAGGTTAIDSIAVDTTTGAGTNPVLPTGAGLITMTGGQYPTGTFGTRVITINSPAPNTLAAEVQISTTSASSLITNNGVCHFNSGDFSIDANGFVSIISGGFKWNNVTSTSATMAAENGYQTNNAGLVTVTLPSTASSTFGDTIKIMGLGAGGWSIAQLAGQQIQVGSSGSTVGVGGSVASTNRYDAIELVYSTTSGLWRAVNFVGNLTVT